MSAPIISGPFTRQAPSHVVLWARAVGMILAVIGCFDHWWSEYRVFSVIGAGEIGYVLAYLVPKHLTYPAEWMSGTGRTAWVLSRVFYEIGRVHLIHWKWNFGLACLC